jgi:hypothetical protein
MKARQNKSRTQTQGTDGVLYSSKIIKAGALLADTKTLLAHWDESQPVAANLAAIRRDNLFGKASRSRVEDILAILRQRYLSDPTVTKALVTLTKHRLPAASLDGILYFHSALTDPLLRDAVTQLLLPMYAQGIVDVNAREFQNAIAKWAAEGKTTTKWSDITICRASQELLATLRDFGVLRGAVNKRIAPTPLPMDAFAYLAFYLKQQQPSAAKLIELPEWKLFFLPREGVERFLLEAHQCNLLEYHAAGSVGRLTFPARTLEEYADVLAQRSH